MNFQEKLDQARQNKLLTEEQYLQIIQWSLTLENPSLPLLLSEEEQEKVPLQKDHPTEQPFFLAQTQTEKIDRFPPKNSQKASNAFETFSGNKPDELFETFTQKHSELFESIAPYQEEEDFVKDTSSSLPPSSDVSFENLSLKNRSLEPPQNTSDLFESFSKKHPSSFGLYDIIRPIARGGMGAVYLVRHQKQQKEYALKVISNNYDENVLKRFQNEVSLVAQLKHPGIVAVHDYGENEGIPYLVMDLIQGESLAHFLKKKGPFPLKKGLKIMIQICMALDYAHSHGVIHRDLKPDNILLTPQEIPLLVDFGLAKKVHYEQSQKLTQTGQILGTPAYMAPEVISSETQEIGVCTDIYGLGITLYELLTAKLPFSSQNSLNLFHQILNHPPLSPRIYNSAIPTQVETIILKCLQKNPKARYEDVRSLSRDISRYLSDIPIQSRISFSFRSGAMWVLNHWFYLFVLFGLLYALKWNHYYQKSIQTLSQQLQQQIQKEEEERQNLETYLVLDRRNALRSQLEQIQNKEQIQQTQQMQQAEQQALQTEIITLQKQKEQLQHQTQQFQKDQQFLQQNIQNQWFKILLLCEETPLQKILFAEKEGLTQNSAFQLYQRGLQEEKKGDWKKAREIYKKFEEISLEVALWKQFLLAFYPFEDQKECDKLLQELEKIAPQSVFTFQAKATLLFENQEYSKLQTLLDQSKSFTENAYYQYFYGIFACHLINLKGSSPRWWPKYQPDLGKEALAQATQYAPLNPKYSFVEGVSYYLSGNIEFALRAFYQTAALQETSMTDTFLGIIFYELQQFEKAGEYLQKALQKDKENEMASYYLGRFYLDHEKNYSQALEIFEKTNLLFKNRQQFHHYVFPGHQKIIERFSLEMQPIYAYLLLHSGQWQKSSWLYDDFVKKNIYIQEGFIGSGKILLFQGNPHQAQDYFYQAFNTLGAKTQQTLNWNSFLALKPQKEQKLSWLLGDLPKASLKANPPYYISSSLLVFRELGSLNSVDLQEELAQIAPNERAWFKEMLLYFRDKKTIESVWLLAQTEELQTKTALYLGLLKRTQKQEKEAIYWFEKCYQLHAFGMEEFFMAWIALGGTNYPR